MVEQDDLASVELHFRELTEQALDAARRRADCEAAVTRARDVLETSQRDLPIAERDAKERRQSQNDAIRGRAELEHRLAELVESEDLTRQRRQQADQRAQGFRAAAAFAAAGRLEAEGAGDLERAERERLVEDRATREAVTAETRAAEELAEETKINRHRTEIETHVEAERALEAEIAADRADAETRVTDLREAIESATFELREAEANLERLEADRERLVQERAQAAEQLREIGQRARVQIEAQIAELRAQEAEIAGRREEQERLLAVLLEAEKPSVLELEPVTPQAEHPPSETHDDTEHGSAPQAAAEAGTPEPATEPSAPEPHFSTVTFSALPPREGVPARPAQGDYGSADDRSGVRSLIGNIFTRRKAVEEPVEDEGPTIAERIARDFGLLGASDDEVEAEAHAGEPHAGEAHAGDAHATEPMAEKAS